MAAPRTTHRTALLQALVAQQRWIDDHGGSCAGYVARYGAASDPDHYGHGGEAIYAADRTQLERLQAAYDRACERMPRGAR